MGSPPKLNALHPGKYIREEIIPNEMTVSKFAKLLGVGRPAVSNLLNEKADLSPEMALRIEKVFPQVKSRTLLELQAKYNAVKASRMEADIPVQAFTHQLYHVTAKELENWANTNLARENLSAVVRTLINSTPGELNLVDLPAFDESQRKGWDGRVSSEFATPWIPRGESGWELSCRKDIKTKADLDYKSRLKKVPLKARKNTTFVFVTPRIWNKKYEWVKEKNETKQWKEIRVIDAIDLEQWIEQSVPAQIRIHEFLGRDNQKICTLYEVWKEWSYFTNPRLPKELFDSEISNHCDVLKSWLDKPPGKHYYITAESILEGQAFIYSVFRKLEEQNHGQYIDKTLVIQSHEEIKRLEWFASGLILILTYPDSVKGLSWIPHNAHIIIVGGKNMLLMDQKVNISLGSFPCKEFCKPLKNSGLGNSEINKLVRQSGQSLTILRRTLAKTKAFIEPPWVKNCNNPRAIIPFLFTGTWNWENDEDLNVLKQFFTEQNTSPETAFKDFQDLEESPVWSIGDYGGVISRKDCLYTIKNHITKEDLNKFFCTAEKVLNIPNTKRNLPSDALRKGICNTLVLLCVEAETLFPDRLIGFIHDRARNLIQNILKPIDASKWLTNRNILSYFAEASPDTFLHVLEFDLKKNDPSLAVLFKQPGDKIFGECKRVDLLNALEIIAWNPDYLERVVLTLASMCRWEIKDNRINSPLNTLKSIFWYKYPQTEATAIRRIQVLKMLCRKFPEIGWEICINQLNPTKKYSFPICRPYWRSIESSSHELIPEKDRQKAEDGILEIIFGWPNHDKKTLGDLVQCILPSNSKIHKKIWKLVYSWLKDNPNDFEIAYLREKIRQSILTYRSKRDKNFDDSTLLQAKEMLVLLESNDPVAKHQWLFVNEWIDDETDSEEFDFDEWDKTIYHRRQNAIDEIWEQLGLNGIMQLCQVGSTSLIIGKHLAEILNQKRNNIDVIFSLLQQTLENPRFKLDQCLNGILGALNKEIFNTVIVEFSKKYSSNKELGIRLFCLAPFTSDTWKYVNERTVEFKQDYWRKVTPRWGHSNADYITTIVDELILVDRPRAALFATKFNLEKLDSFRIVRLLNSVATNFSEPKDEYRIDRNDISDAFSILDERSDTSSTDIAMLEFKFIQVLLYSKHGIPNLETELSKSPELFLEALSAAFNPRDEDGKPKKNPSKHKENSYVSSLAFELLNNAKKVPGTLEDGSIDANELDDWVRETTVLIQQNGYYTTGMQMVGQLLSHCPVGEDGIWPCEPVRKIIENYGATDLELGIIMGKCSGDDVGELVDKALEKERKLSHKFKNWSQELDYQFPRSAKILFQISKNYDRSVNFMEDVENLYSRLDNQ